MMQPAGPNRAIGVPVAALLLVAVPLAALAPATMTPAAMAQGPLVPAPAVASAALTTADDMRAAMWRAQRERQQAQARSQRLERAAETARSAVDQSAAQAAALAARIQQAEAGIAAAAARRQLVERERASLLERLGQQQQPVVQLTAALQNLARRPVALSLLRPGTVNDLVHTRALLAAAVPQVQQRTGDLRARIARLRLLREAAAQALAVLRAEEFRLAERQRQLALLQARQRATLRQASGVADREAERVLALAERTRDLDSLVADLDRAAALRSELAALPGPLPRPQDPSAARPAMVAERSSAPNGAGPQSFILPVTGRLVQGFGVPSALGPSKGITLAPRGGAQVVAPAAGRVAFAGAYRGYGRIVIMEHAGGWTSLVTGLGRTAVAPGDVLLAGAPLGVTPQGASPVMLELRQGGRAVDPLPLIG